MLICILSFKYDRLKKGLVTNPVYQQNKKHIIEVIQGMQKWDLPFAAIKSNS